MRPTPEVRQALAAFAEDVYLHQVVVCRADGQRFIYFDLKDVLAGESENDPDNEWRIHFHIPLHSRPSELFDNTSDHILGVLGVLRNSPDLCKHLEMETYTWEVMPSEMKNRSVVDQLAAEYDWTLQQLASFGFGHSG